jgi:IS1 family transposase/transposase-like protein
MDWSTCYCRNRHCRRYGRSRRRAWLESAGWHEGARRWKCLACDHRFSSRAGTAYAGIRTPEGVYRKGVCHLAEGVSIRATARLMECDKDTVGHWLPRVGRHCQRVLDYFFRVLHLSECQLDELWTFVYKKERHLTMLEKLAGRYGDAWIWTAFDPVHKLVPAWRVGKRTQGDARKFINALKNRLDEHIPFFTSDDLPHYADALLDTYGEWYTPPRRGTRGRLPAPRQRPPAELCYAVIIKEREGSRVVQVSTRLIYGTEEQLRHHWKTSAVSHTINTYGVERNNLTVRQHSRRLGRKVNAFSKKRAYLKYQLALAFAYYHFCCPHRGLRQKLPRPIPTKQGNGSPKKWRRVTPAMAASLTDHVWTMDELLSFRVPPTSQWE